MLYNALFYAFLFILMRLGLGWNMNELVTVPITLHIRHVNQVLCFLAFSSEVSTIRGIWYMQCLLLLPRGIPRLYALIYRVQMNTSHMQLANPAIYVRGIFSHFQFIERSPRLSSKIAVS